MGARAENRATDSCERPGLHLAEPPLSDRFYIGLATTCHDPAIAVVDGRGEVLFAEATERALGDKRASGQPADLRATVRRIVRDHCHPRGRYVVAKSWSRTAQNGLALLDLLGVSSHERLSRRSATMTRLLVDRRAMFSSAWLQHSCNILSGGNVAHVLGQLGNGNVSYVSFPHHLTHAATGCFTSPFEEAACAVVDGQGEFGSITWFHYRDGRIRTIKRMRGSESLGLLYAFCTELCGFSAEDGEEWKLMGLAPYGTLSQEIQAELEALVQVNGMTFSYPSTRFVRDWVGRMRRRARAPGASPLTVADLACTVQHFFEKTMTHLLRNFHALGVSDNLVFAGGCALNSSYNGRILESTGFKRLHVPSAPADDGNALGAALLAFHRDNPATCSPARMHSPYLGSSISSRALCNLVRFGRVEKLEHLPGTVCARAAELLADGKLVGWVQGRAEFGPRALGNRSILADPRPADMKDRINSLVKFREEFRPFAPAILDEFGEEYFEDYQVSPYMERTLTFRECAARKVPAIAHVNRTGRLQSVRREWNEKFWQLLHEFHGLTGVPLLLNTSFNIMGRPIIHTLEDALGTFYTTGLDALVVEDYLIEK